MYVYFASCIEPLFFPYIFKYVWKQKASRPASIEMQHMVIFFTIAYLLLGVDILTDDRITEPKEPGPKPNRPKPKNG